VRVPLTGPLALPYPPYARRVALVAVVVWVGLRLFMALPPLSASALSTAASVWAIGLVALLVWLDGRRFREDLFHANLGTAHGWTAAIGAAVATVMEVAVRVLFGMLS
jgi:hypothetical protein